MSLSALRSNFGFKRPAFWSNLLDLSLAVLSWPAWTFEVMFMVKIWWISFEDCRHANWNSSKSEHKLHLVVRVGSALQFPPCAGESHEPEWSAYTRGLCLQENKGCSSDDMNVCVYSEVACIQPTVIAMAYLVYLKAMASNLQTMTSNILGMASNTYL